MELIRSLTVDSLPSISDLFRFGLIQTLQLFKTVLLLYPLNVILLASVFFSIFYKIVKKIMPKSRFSATYAPLPHHQNSTQQIKVLKKEIRDVQSQLIELLNKARSSSENEQILQKQPKTSSSEEDSQFHNFLSQSVQKSRILQEVEEQLKQTVVAAYQEVLKLRSQ